MPTQQGPRDRPQGRSNADQTENENATIGDQIQENERSHEETRRRKEDGTARHGPPPGSHGLTDEPLQHLRGTRSDRREGISSSDVRGHRQHIPKDHADKFPEETDTVDDSPNRDPHIRDPHHLKKS